MRDIASETLELLESGGYRAPSGAEVDLSESQRKAVEETRLYTPERLAELVEHETSASGAAVIRVVNAST